jgi:hypothetical protein
MRKIFLIQSMFQRSQLNLAWVQFVLRRLLGIKVQSNISTLRLGQICDSSYSTAKRCDWQLSLDTQTISRFRDGQWQDKVESFVKFLTLEDLWMNSGKIEHRSDGLFDVTDPTKMEISSSGNLQKSPKLQLLFFGDCSDSLVTSVRATSYFT